MKKFTSIIMAIGLIIISSCSTKPPTLKNPANGIAAIPLEVTNTSGWEFARYYEIIDETRPEMSVKIYPQSNQTFVFSREVPAGEYYFSKIKHIINPKYESQASVVEQPIIVRVDIKPGSVTIVDEKFVLNQSVAFSNSGDGAVSCQCYFLELTDGEMRSFVAKFKETAGDSEWKIANDL